MRTRMSWDWVGEYPVFIYTTWLKHTGSTSAFHVKVVVGKKGDQNAPGYGPGAPASFEYETNLFKSKDETVAQALTNAKSWISENILGEDPECADGTGKLGLQAKQFENELDYIEEINQLHAEVVKLRSDIKTMVQKAAENHLDGYRQLAKRCADLENVNDSLRTQLEEMLEQNSCGDCLEYEDDGTPYTGYGWNENAVEGQVPCACIEESGPYQVLKAELERLK